MDPSIWTHLPYELLERILSFLPLRSLLSLRPTCKHFNSLLSSPSFLSLLHSPSPSSFLLFSHPHFSDHHLPIYSSSSNSWRTISISSSSSSHLLYSSSGLLCFSLAKPSSQILISNPVTKASRVVSSPTHHFSTPTIVSSTSGSPHGYNIFLPCSDSNWVFVYDSKVRSWTRFPGFHPLLAHQHGAFLNGSLYFTTPEPFSLVGFNLSSGNWGSLLSPVLPADLAFVRLVSAGGHRFYLISGEGRDGIARILRVWELAGEAWGEVGRLPEMMFRKFAAVCYHNYSHVYCIWHAGLVCVCCTTWPEVLFYKVARGTWHWLPKCPLLQEKWSCGFKWFSFVPDLYALV